MSDYQGGSRGGSRSEYRRRRNPVWRYLNLGVLAGAAGLGLFAFLLVFVGLMLARPDPGPVIPATAVLSVVNAPTATPTIVQSTQIAATASVPASPLAGDLAVGAYVQISGTGGDGLRLRSEPGLNGLVYMVVSEAEVFLVVEGPVDIDGYTWWRLVGPFDETRQGWGVANFLVAVQNPN